MAQDTTPTPAETLDAATQKDVELQSGARPTLIGTYIKDDGNSAIIRLHTGRIKTVARGDRIGQASVAVIDDGFVDLALRGITYRLKVPAAA